MASQNLNIITRKMQRRSDGSLKKKPRGGNGRFRKVSSEDVPEHNKPETEAATPPPKMVKLSADSVNASGGPVEPMVSVKTSATPPTKGIRTRLSTGTLIMTGTSTVSLASQEYSTPTSFDTGGASRKNLKDAMPGSSRKRKGQDDEDSSGEPDTPPKRRKIGRNDGTGEDNKNDYFCWICHKEGLVICCELCPRVYHSKCLSCESNVPDDWVCPECEKIMKAECTDTRSKSMAMITLDTLCTLLKYALDRMRTVGASTFENPVDPLQFPNYSDYVFYPMSLSLLEKNVRRKMYGCTEAFFADAKWIYHNSAVYNGSTNKITSAAKSLMKVCKHEMTEIEVCPDCYYHSCVQNNSDWFCEPCRTPHPLVWAKLKGYPFWPAKALREVNGQIDVRFFGAHDRSWVPVASCFMLSKNCPVVVKKGRGGMDLAMKEVSIHVKKLKEKFGSFEYAPLRTPFSIDNVYENMKNINSDTSLQRSESYLGRKDVKLKVAVRRKIKDGTAASKTARAVKSKYGTISSKKGAQQHGSVVGKAGSTGPVQRQVFYLRPMPKGVFLLSQPPSESVPSTSKGNGTNPNLPELWLVKSASTTKTTTTETGPKIVFPSRKLKKETLDTPTGDDSQNAGSVVDLTEDMVSGTQRTPTQEKSVARQPAEKPVEKSTLICVSTASQPVRPGIIAVSTAVRTGAMAVSTTSQPVRTGIMAVSTASLTGAMAVSTTSQPVRTGILAVSTASLTGAMAVSTTSQPVRTGILAVSSTSQPVRTGIMIVSTALQPVRTSCLTSVSSTTLQPVRTGSTVITATSQPARTSITSVSITTQSAGTGCVNTVSATSQQVRTGLTPVSSSSQLLRTSLMAVSSISQPAGTTSPTPADICVSSVEPTDQSSVQKTVLKTPSTTVIESGKSVCAKEPKINEPLQNMTRSSDPKEILSEELKEDSSHLAPPLCSQTGKEPQTPPTNLANTTTSTTINQSLATTENSEISEKKDDSPSVLQSAEISNASGLEENDKSKDDQCLNSSKVSSNSEPQNCLPSGSLTPPLATTSGSSVSPGSIYKENLQKVIETCKAKLGIENQNDDVETLILSDDDDEEDLEAAKANEDSDSEGSGALLMDIDDPSEHESSRSGNKEPGVTQSSEGLELMPEDPLPSRSEGLKGGELSALSKTKDTEGSVVEEGRESVEKEADAPTATPSSIGHTDSTCHDDSVECIENSEQTVRVNLDDSVIPSVSGVKEPVVTDANESTKEKVVKVLGVSMETTEEDLLKESELDQVITIEDDLSDDDDEEDDNVEDHVSLDMEVICEDGSGDDDRVNEGEPIPKRSNDSTEKAALASADSNATKDKPQTSILAFPKIKRILSDPQPVTTTPLPTTSPTFSTHPMPALTHHSAKSSTATPTTPSTPKPKTKGKMVQIQRPIIVSSGAGGITYMVKLKEQKNTSDSQTVQSIPALMKSPGKSIAEAQCRQRASSLESTDRLSSQESSSDRDGLTPGLTGAVQTSESRTQVLNEGDQSCQTGTGTTLSKKISNIVRQRTAVIEHLLSKQIEELVKDVENTAKAAQSAINVDAINEKIEDLKKEQAKELDKQKKDFEQKIKDAWKIATTTVKEVEANFDLQKKALGERLKEKFNKELEKAVAETKKMQWCAECWQEAVYYCCWNTSYCGFECQQKHWPAHMPKCMQTQQQQQQGQNVPQSPNQATPNQATPNQAMKIISTLTPVSHNMSTASPIVTPVTVKSLLNNAKQKKAMTISSQKTNEEAIPVSYGQNYQIDLQYVPQQRPISSVRQQVQVVGSNTQLPIIMPSIISNGVLRQPVQVIRNFPLVRQSAPNTPTQPNIENSQYIITSGLGGLVKQARQI
ncbi:MYND-type zinc finger-containing chromatin reader ZMYND8-like isoform X2 [Physella acuta]|uniref:MYND-type zinc finger-containing chromatin reader ZMYND8-like isoform X2 n=1 Tax=Physella acuta TaxID=109671 RepID=UPI0027DE2601|nr:MYND-type zinc finger-containing chromatin reader ZMYND8-like isoform X2 [Physella acuta]